MGYEVILAWVLPSYVMPCDLTLAALNIIIAVAMHADNTLISGLIIEAVRLLCGAVLLALTWSLGQRILARSELRKKRREIDISLSLDFQQRFGEFKAIWRRWRAHYAANLAAKEPPKVAPSDVVRWKLFEDATGAEAKLEAAFVKLATERCLSEKDIKCLGLFRQAYQELREAIRDGKKMDYHHDHPAYVFFNVYGGRVAHIISRGDEYKEPTAMQAEENLLAIQAPRREDWAKAVEHFAAERKLPFPDPQQPLPK